MSGPLAHTRRWGRLLPLLPLAALIVASCALVAAPEPYTGVKARTALDKIPAGGEMKNFTLVGQNPLVESRFNLPRGQNGGITAIRDCVYVGSNIWQQPTLIVDMKDMTKPTVVGELEGIKGRAMGVEAVEGVADLNLLVNTARGGDSKRVAANEKTIGMVVYDATDCRKPTVVSKIDVFNEDTHYMVLWRDPNKPDRVLASLSYSNNKDGVDIRVWDLTGCPKSCNPKLAAEWGLRAQMGVPQNITTKYEGGERRDNTTTHDHTYSLDGKRIHLGQTRYGYLQIDSSALAEGRQCNLKAATSPTAQGHCLTVFPKFAPLASFGVEVATVHGVVQVPGRPYVILHHEGGNCPYAGITVAYVGDRDEYNTYNKVSDKVESGGSGAGSYRADLFPRRVGMFAVPEANPDRCPKPGDQVPPTTGATGLLGRDSLLERKDVHNTIAFPSFLIGTWYGAGLRAVDITNPFTPFELGFYFDKPPLEVRWCDGRSSACADVEVDAEGVPVRQKNLTPPGIISRSYPIIMNGHVVYSDSNAGLQVLKYTGPHAEEIPQQGLCIAHNPSVVKVGFDPCPPYKGWNYR